MNAVKHGKVLQCSCQHAFQDGWYGRGMRYHNPLAAAQNQPQRWRCSVCSAVRTA